MSIYSLILEKVKENISLKNNFGLVKQIYAHVYKIVCYQDFYDLNKHLNNINSWTFELREKFKKSKVKKEKFIKYIKEKLTTEEKTKIINKVDLRYINIPKRNNDIKTVDHYFNKIINSIFDGNTEQILKDLKRYVEKEKENYYI
jgi:hypothetical protein